MTDRRQLESFLLGTCDEATAVSIQERLFADNALLDELRQAEISLLEQSVAGTLSPELRKQMGEQVERSPRLRAEMDAVRLRCANLEAKKHVQVHVPLSWWRANGRVLAPTFALLPLLAGGSLAWYKFRQASHTVSLHEEARNGAAVSQPKPDLTAAERRATTAVPSSEAGAVATVFLPGLVLRGDDAAPVVHLAKDIKSLEIQMEVRPAAAQGAAWSCGLFHRGKLLHQWEDIPERSEGEIHYLSVLAPSVSLPAGIYELRITGPKGMEHAALQATRTFVVAPR